MKCKVDKSTLSGTISCPPNKSYSHRAIFLASLANGKSTLGNVLLSRDTLATVNACKAFGAKIKISDSTVTVESTGEIIPQTSQIDASNSGTTIRIATAIASLADKKITLTGDSSLQKRPMQPLLDALTQLGVECTSTDGKPPVTVKGRSDGGNTHISGSISSQFISALFISGPKMKNGITLEIDGELVSKPYLDATIATMKKFGVTVDAISPYKKYDITNQKYRPSDFVVPSDFSSMALLLSAAVLLGNNMSIDASLGDLPQGDREILSYLERLGVKINLGEKITLVSPKLLNGGRFDLSNNPDLLPPMAILALKTSKPIEIYNVKHARFKETDRIAILAKELAKIGITVTEKEDGLILDAPKTLKGAELESSDDHRLFMAFAIAGMFVGDCTVTDPDSVDVSYPTFVEDMRKIGANLTI
ncbi:MAG: 3-phosphoshikimate 1-carboxyvinyltransferase [Thaumarchaeota archaeon]|nr:3-phosphoshikimate 1-carboxyvinyltransferase [Nitrososphaerota archaeon]MDE1817129.1 3-phosphoshikimate 1-carboxyvinyltransferase [Nitrososphaerota archaeon]MDE1876132.1 3-phosphoshikimate 1-carboxyvinyltransferase [Nitrososphaerota archaeon]